MKRKEPFTGLDETTQELRSVPFDGIDGKHSLVRLVIRRAQRYAEQQALQSEAPTVLCVVGQPLFLSVCGVSPPTDAGLGDPLGDEREVRGRNIKGPLVEKLEK